MDERVEQLSKHVYKVQGSNPPICVTAVDEKYAITFRHEPHHGLGVGSVLTLRHALEIAQEIDQCTVEVLSINDAADVILLGRKEGDFPVPTRALRDPRIGEAYLQLGLGRDSLRPDEGIISQTTVISHVPFLTGSGKSLKGDSGGAVFGNDNALIGMVVGAWSLNLNETCTHNAETLSHHHPSAFICPIAFVRRMIEYYELAQGIRTEPICYGYSTESVGFKNPPPSYSTAIAGPQPPPSYLPMVPSATHNRPFSSSNTGYNRAASAARFPTPPSSASPSPPPCAKMTISYGRHGSGNQYTASIEQCSQFTFNQFRKLFAIGSRTNKRFFFKAGVQGQPSTAFHWVAVVDDSTPLPFFDGGIEAKFKLLSEMDD